jgi:transposase
MQARKEKTFEKKLEKENKRAKGSLGKLRRREFACEADARKEADLWLLEHSLYMLNRVSITQAFASKSANLGMQRSLE